MNWLNLPRYADHLKDRLSSFISVDILTRLDKKQVYGVMLVSALVSRNFSFARDIEAIIKQSADKKTIAIAKSTAIYVDMKKNEDLSSLLESEVVETNFWIYMLAASFICSFASYIKLREKLQQNKYVDKDTVNDVIRVAATIQSISEIHKEESKRKKKILVVDDEVRLTRILKKTLEKTGQYEVRIENNGSNAVNAVHVFKPDLILLDIIMPDMGGEEVAARIREDKELSHTRIVFLSGILSKEETGNTGKEIGGYLCLAKPVRDDDLVYCIDQQISKSKAA